MCVFSPPFLNPHGNIYQESQNIIQNPPNKLKSKTRNVTRNWCSCECKWKCTSTYRWCSAGKKKRKTFSFWSPFKNILIPDRQKPSPVLIYEGKCCKLIFLENVFPTSHAVSSRCREITIISICKFRAFFEPQYKFLIWNANTYFTPPLKTKSTLYFQRSIEICTAKMVFCFSLLKIVYNKTRTHTYSNKVQKKPQSDRAIIVHTNIKNSSVQ